MNISGIPVVVRSHPEAAITYKNPLPPRGEGNLFEQIVLNVRPNHEREDTEQLFHDAKAHVEAVAKFRATR